MCHPAAWKPFTEGCFISPGFFFFFFKETTAFDLNNGCFLTRARHRADLSFDRDLVEGGGGDKGGYS